MNKKITIFIVLLVAMAALSAYAQGPGRGSRGLRGGQKFATDDEPGLLVSGVVADSPAEEAGMVRGDVLLAIDGKEVESTHDIREILSEYKAGQRVTLTVLRGGDETSVTLNLEDRLYRPILGLEFLGGGYSGINMFRGPRFDTGVIVVEVIEDGPADNAGVEPRDAILSVDGERVSPGEFQELIASHEPGDRITLEISRPGEDGDEPFEIVVRLGENDDGGALLGVRYGFPGAMMFDFMPEFRERMERFDRDLRGRMEGYRIQIPIEEPDKSAI